MIYTEILKKKKYKDEEQMQEYIEKIEQKTQRMKQLSERIFEYSLVTSEMEVALSEPEWFETVFYDLLSETCVYLEQRGYQIELNVRWESTNIGLRNIKNMMNSMNGKCEVENDGNRFKITLRFPVIQKM